MNKKNPNLNRHFKDRIPDDIIYYTNGKQRASIISQRRLTEKRTFQTTPEMSQAINDIAALAGISPSDVIRNAIEHAIPHMVEELRRCGRSMPGP